MGHVFLSYSRADAEIADRIIHALSTQTQVWSTGPGSPAARSGGARLSKRSIAATASRALLSPRSVQSENVRKELDIAEDKKSGSCPSRH